MRKSVIKENVSPDKVIKVELKASENEKGEAIVMRVRNCKKVKRYVNRKYNRVANTMAKFCTELGISSNPGVYEVSCSSLMKAVKVFPKAA